ncbi:MAG: hypothetical protein PHI19_06180 [Clostridia bacterium]|nr:hypothetical protein [Clostridia bacterium]
MIKLWAIGMFAHLGLFKILFNSRGEAGSGGDGKAGEPGDKGAGKTFTQDQLDAIVQDRLSRERKKFADYDDLAKFKQEHDKNVEATKEKELESQRKYEEVKKTWEGKEAEYQKKLREADEANRNLRIDYSLNSEISKLNAYPEAAQAIRPLIVLDKDGMPKIKGKNEHGIDTELPLAEGVKKFLDDRPYLVKASSQTKGGGTLPAGGGGSGEGITDLATLNDQYLKAISSGNHKLAGEIKMKMKAYFASKEISRSV